jgi:hypothetical protein
LSSYRARFQWRARPARARPYLIGELLVVLALVKFYDAVRSLAPSRQREAVAHGRDILSLETDMHLDIERVVNHALTGSRMLTELAAGWYQFTHLGVTLTALACCYRWRPDLYRPARNSLVAVNLIGLVIFWLYPVAPPRLLPGLGFLDADLMAGYGLGPAGPVSANLFAAMPSLHLAWATWTVIVVRKMLITRRWPRRLVPVYAGITSLVVVATANHYLLDVAAGIAVCLLASWATGLTSAPSPPPVDVAPPARPVAEGLRTSSGSRLTESSACAASGRQLTDKSYHRIRAVTLGRWNRTSREQDNKACAHAESNAQGTISS